MLMAVLMAGSSYLIKQRAQLDSEQQEKAAEQTELERTDQEKNSVKSSLMSSEIELVFGKQISSHMIPKREELAFRMNKMRKKFASQYGFVVPDVRLKEDLTVADKTYEIRIHGTMVATHDVRIGEILILIGDGEVPSIPGEETKEPAFGLDALWISKTAKEEAEIANYTVVDLPTVMATHITEVIRSHGHELFGRQEADSLIDNFKRSFPKVVEEVVPDVVPLGGVVKVLQNLL